MADSQEGRALRRARTYDLGTEIMYLGSGRSFRENLLDLALLKHGEGFLDVGCGPGRLVMAACTRVGRLGGAYGVDMSPQMIRYARKKAARYCPAARLFVASAQELPFDDGFFDAVTCTLVMHHVPADGGRQRAFSEMRRVLCRGGRLVIVELERGGGPVGRAISRHMEGASISSYIDMMVAEGFGRINTGGLGIRPMTFLRGIAE